jgi:hypothetical protein
MNKSTVVFDDKTWREEEVAQQFLVMTSWYTRRSLGQNLQREGRAKMLSVSVVPSPKFESIVEMKRIKQHVDVFNFGAHRAFFWVVGSSSVLRKSYTAEYPLQKGR